MLHVHARMHLKFSDAHLFRSLGQKGRLRQKPSWCCKEACDTPNNNSPSPVSACVNVFKNLYRCQITIELFDKAQAWQLHSSLGVKVACFSPWTSTIARSIFYKQTNKPYRDMAGCFFHRDKKTPKYANDVHARLYPSWHCTFYACGLFTNAATMTAHMHVNQGLRLLVVDQSTGRGNRILVLPRFDIENL